MEIKVRIAIKDTRCDCCGGTVKTDQEYYWIQKPVQGLLPNKTIGQIITYLRYCPDCKEANYGDSTGR